MKGSYQSLYEFGSTFLGPMLSVYVKAVSDNIDNKVPVCLAREGWLLYGLLNELSAENHLELPLPPVYLKVSRTVLLRASLGTASSWKLGLNSKFQGTVLQLLMNRFALGFHEAFSTLPEDLLSFNVKLPEQSHQVTEWLEPHADRLESLVKKTKDGLTAYLQQSGLKSSDIEPLMLDIGYSGTIQKLLTELLEKDTSGLYFVSLKSGKQRVGRYHANMNGVFHEDIAWNDGYSMLDKSLLLESLMTAPHGSIIDIRCQHNGELAFFYGRETTSQVFYQDLSVVFRGAIDEVKKIIEKGIYYSAEEIENLYRVYTETRGAIPSELGYLFGIDDDFSGNGVFNPIDFFGL